MNTIIPMSIATANPVKDLKNVFDKMYACGLTFDQVRTAGQFLSAAANQLKLGVAGRTIGEDHKAVPLQQDLERITKDAAAIARVQQNFVEWSQNQEQEKIVMKLVASIKKGVPVNMSLYSTDLQEKVKRALTA